jgi:hypothetical protein
MPQPTRNAPDYIDLQRICSALGEDYSVVVYFTTRIRADFVEIIGKTHSAPYTQEAPVEHVALATFPLRNQKDMATVLYTIAFDLWCQHDGGGATAAKRGTPYTWRGYPETPRRRK